MSDDLFGWDMIDRIEIVGFGYISALNWTTIRNWKWTYAHESKEKQISRINFGDL